MVFEINAILCRNRAHRTQKLKTHCNQAEERSKCVLALVR
ncbi:hypothetical protein GALL_448870 [mine drainage metagenome]|uniref:Uncharacterized protein n=1 Tax=mine drainage metagenome TaxID=410659 RepID=A0A1J5PPR4_9ZZZZ